MPLLKFVTEIVPKKIEVLVSNPSSSLGAALIGQLQLNKNIEIKTLVLSDSSETNLSKSNIESPGVIIHLVGFSNSSFSDTLSYTTHLHQLLLLAKDNNSKFILCLPNTRTHLYHTSITLVTQFAKNFALKYQIIEVDKSSNVSDVSYDIIKKFVRFHQKPKSLPSPSSKLAEILSTPSRPSPPPPKITSKPQKLTLPHISAPTLPRLKSFKLVGLVIALALLPYLFFFGALTFLWFSLLCTGSSAGKFQIPSLSRCAKLAHISSTTLSSISFLPGTTQILHRLNLPLPEVDSTAQNIYNAASQLDTLLTSSTKYFSAVLSSNSSEKSPDLGPQLALISESIAAVQTDLRAWYNETDWSASNPPPATFTSSAQAITQFKEIVSKLLPVAEELPSFISASGKTTYAILVQDNTELRPSGGYLDSFILVTLEDGLLQNMELISSQAADSQLKGEVEAPSDFKALTGQNTWFLRDSNWDADFPTTARRVAWFVDKELGRPVDVVVATNITSLSVWLKVFGSVKLNDPEQTVSWSNLTSSYLTYLQTHTQSDSYLYKVLEKVLDQAKQVTPEKLSKLIPETIKLLEQREIQIFPVTLPSLSLESVGWGGGVGLPGCRSQINCQIDYLFQYDTNLSVNKTDALTKKTGEISVTIKPDEIIKEYKYDYSNTSKETVWPAGEHKNYFRLLFPAKAQITSLSLNGQSLPTSQYTISQQNGLNQLGLVITTKPQSQSSLTVKTTESAALTSKFHYQLDLSNQPGASEIPLKINLTFPNTWFSTIFSERSLLTPVVASPGLIRYNTNSSRPRTLDLDLAPN